MKSSNGHEVQANDHILGPAKGKVTLIQYGDFECGFCHDAFPIVEKLCERFKDDLTFVFRHFPLTQMHPEAESAARASEAASNQGRFWPMHKLLYEAVELSENNYARFASQLGLDLDRFADDFADDGVEAKIKGDFMGGIRLGVNGTPAFFVDGELFEGNWKHGALEKMISVKLDKPHLHA